eukprot:GHVS01090234.1.p1 GENE.GHVS01090234.1~~GHVS01090234.1.p1  ORF type:complete len:954 (+),score=186.79 GHVS01090234.1:191-3052(+)
MGNAMNCSASFLSSYRLLDESVLLVYLCWLTDVVPDTNYWANISVVYELLRKTWMALKGKGSSLCQIKVRERSNKGRPQGQDEQEEEMKSLQYTKMSLSAPNPRQLAKIFGWASEELQTVEVPLLHKTKQRVRYHPVQLPHKLAQAYNQFICKNKRSICADKTTPCPTFLAIHASVAGTCGSGQSTSGSTTSSSGKTNSASSCNSGSGSSGSGGSGSGGSGSGSSSGSGGSVLSSVVSTSEIATNHRRKEGAEAQPKEGNERDGKASSCRCYWCVFEISSFDAPPALFSLVDSDTLTFHRRFSMLDKLTECCTRFSDSTSALEADHLKHQCIQSIGYIIACQEELRPAAARKTDKRRQDRKKETEEANTSSREKKTEDMRQEEGEGRLLTAERRTDEGSCILTNAAAAVDPPVTEANDSRLEWPYNRVCPSAYCQLAGQSSDSRNRLIVLECDQRCRVALHHRCWSQRKKAQDEFSGCCWTPDCRGRLVKMVAVEQRRESNGTTTVLSKDISKQIRYNSSIKTSEDNKQQSRRVHPPPSSQQSSRKPPTTAVVAETVAKADGQPPLPGGEKEAEEEVVPADAPCEDSRDNEGMLSRPENSSVCCPRITTPSLTTAVVSDKPMSSCERSSWMWPSSVFPVSKLPAGCAGSSGLLPIGSPLWSSLPSDRCRPSDRIAAGELDVDSLASLLLPALLLRGNQADESERPMPRGGCLDIDGLDVIKPARRVPQGCFDVGLDPPESTDDSTATTSAVSAGCGDMAIRCGEKGVQTGTGRSRRKQSHSVPNDLPATGVSGISGLAGCLTSSSWPHIESPRAVVFPCFNNPSSVVLSRVFTFEEAQHLLAVYPTVYNPSMRGGVALLLRQRPCESPSMTADMQLRTLCDGALVASGVFVPHSREDYFLMGSKWTVFVASWNMWKEALLAQRRIESCMKMFSDQAKLPFCLVGELLEDPRRK